MSAYAKVVLAIVLLAVGFAAGFGWERRGRIAEVATIRTEHAQVMTNIANLTSEALQKTRTAEQKTADAINAIDTRISKERTDALAENSRIAADVASGARRLRIAATCPARSGDVPTGAAATSVDAAAPIEIPAAVGQDLFDLRAGIISDQAALKGLQEYVKAITAQPN